MNPNLELSIREAVGVKTGIIYEEILDRFNQTTEVENARAIFFKLLLEYVHLTELLISQVKNLPQHPNHPRQF